MGRQLHVDHLLVGVVGGFQPDKLVKAFAGDDDGMYARFIFAWPEQAPHTKLADEIGSVDHNLKDTGGPGIEVQTSDRSAPQNRCSSTSRSN